MIKTVMIVGQKWLGAEALRLCQELGLAVAAVAVPDPADRLAAAAVAAGLPVALVPRALSPEQVPPGVDLLVCAHAHCFISSGARERAALGAIGYHPSLLPRHRGRDAVRWAIHMREPVTGGTVYWLDDRADTGPIAAQDWCWVHPDDTPELLWRRDLAPMGIRLLRQVLLDLAQGVNAPLPQDERLATWEPAFTSHQLRPLSSPPST